ncbi:MAG: DUF1611 domain-containing protein [Chloroflexi bacterium OHK40]
MHRLELSRVKRTFTTHRVPAAALGWYTPVAQPPAIGDLLVAEVLSLGKHSSIEDCSGLTLSIFPGDQIVGAFGNRYATDQYEGYVPEVPVTECDMLSIGGVCGEVRSAHSSMSVPTRLRVLGAVCDEEGQPINLATFAIPRRRALPHGQVILVVGASMNSGKTTTVGTLVRALTRSGHHVVAAKVTGTAAGKDGRYFASCGASTVLDFTHCGVPSTYMLAPSELVAIFQRLLSNLYAERPDYIVLEIADGIFQRETRMLLASDVVRSSVDHLFFAANDSLSAECGARRLRAEDWPLRAVTGMVTTSPLAMREVEEEVGLPCLNIEALLSERLLGLLEHGNSVALGQAAIGHAA